MKKNIFPIILGLTTVLLTSSVSKADVISSKNTISKMTPATVADPEGTYRGSYWNLYGPDGGPVVYYELNFKPDGSLSVLANGAMAYGTWSMVGDRVWATYSFLGGEEASDDTESTYSLTGKVSGSNISGTIGHGTSTSDAYAFSVTKDGF